MVKSALTSKSTKTKSAKPKATASKPKAAVTKKATKKSKAEPTRAKCATGMQKTKKGCKPKRDPNKPKRAGAPYLFFCKEKRAELKKSDPAMKAPDVLKECGKAWQKVKTGDISKWQKLADTDKERYTREMGKYKATAKELPLEASEAEESED